MNTIILRNINKIYSDKHVEVKALCNLSLVIEKGDMIAIMGASGSGKSTLLNIIGCLDRPTSGEYLLDGEKIEKCSEKERALLRNSKFGFVIQDFALVERYTVKKNVYLPLTYTHKNYNSKNRQVDNILLKLGILDKKNTLSYKLSGGQRQRVAIARAIVNNPDIILADEPTGALDRKTGTEVIRIFQELNKDNKTVIIVTHDMKVARMCRRVLYIQDGEIVTEQN